jgi:AcrR family transcriptional regulator
MGVAQARLIKEAAVLANRTGLENLSMSGLAEALNVRTPTLYSHVAGLSDVKRLLALRGLAELNMAAMQATVGKSGADAVRALLVRYRQFAEKNPGLYAATVPTPPRSDREWSAAVDRLTATVLAALQGYGLAEKDAIHALRGVRSLVHGFVSLEAAGALKHPVERNASFDWLVKGYLLMLEHAAEQSRVEACQ